MDYVFYVYVYIFYYFLCVLRVFFSFLCRVRMCVCVSRHILRLDFVCCSQLIAVVGALLSYCPAQCEALLVVIALKCTILTKTKRKWRKSLVQLAAVSQNSEMPFEVSTRQAYVR